MAIVTIVRRQDMFWILTLGNHAIVTAETTITDVGMVKYRAGPGKSTMTIIAGSTTTNMLCMLTRRGHTIMTTLATTRDSEVINAENALPGARLVTVLTIVGGTDMLHGSRASLYATTA